MQKMTVKIIVIHYGELALRKRNRFIFENKLISNMKGKLDIYGIKGVRKLQGRFVVEFAEGACWTSLKESLLNVFGFANAMPSYRAELDLVDLEKKVVSALPEIKEKSFAVRTKRANKKFKFLSPEISSRVGAAIKAHIDLPVDLKNPDMVVNVEVLDDEIFFSFDKMRGPGGLPVGISGHALTLLSGGIDSPVASWMMMKRGLKNSFVHFHSMPFTNEASIEKVVEMAEILSKWQGHVSLALVPFGDIQKKIVTSVPSKYRVLMYRRFMMRIATHVANMINADALVTGEALGQVASQTLSNMASVEVVSGLPILRPLVGMDKQEIVDLAQKIGTFDLSITPHQDCCSFLQPPDPATRTTVLELDRVEKDLDVDGLVKMGIDNIDWREI